MNNDVPERRIAFCLRRRITRLPAIILIASTLSACGQIFSPAVTPTPELASTAGQILFYGLDYGGISVVNKNGEGVRHLTDENGHFGAWSPDGKQIAYFDVSSSDCCEIFVMRADGTNKTQLTHLQMDIINLAWSPDGKRIAFSATLTNLNGHPWSIYVINIDGSELAHITLGASVGALEWSPDGEHIAFDAGLEHRPTLITIMRADGSDMKVTSQIGNDLCYDQCQSDEDPKWSPDGKQIAFVSNRDGNDEIYVMNDDGSDQRRLTDISSYNGGPSWSPDGKYIAFASNRDGNAEIYMMNADGSDQRRLTDHSSDDFQPNWSPDGKYIAFISDRDGNREIYVMNADGSNQIRLTNNTISDYDPVWSPQVEEK